MDQKTWLWRKRSSEKTIIANGKADCDVKGKEEILPNEKEIALEESVKILNEKLAFLTTESNAKEELLQNHAKMAEEAMAAQKKVEAEVLHLRNELDEALKQKLAANDRLGNLNAALKDCMQQLNVVREEQEQRVNDAIMRTSKEFGNAHKKLEEKFSEANKKLANFTAENSHLSEAIQVKESLIEDLRIRRSQVEAEFDALMARLDSVEKENAFLRYEFRVLEKDLDIRNEEIEFTRRFADASQKHYLESMNKVKKLETECQRLRVMVRKRLPAPALLANLKAEVELQGRRQIETRRRKTNPVSGGLVVRESTRENLDITSKRISFLVDRLQNAEQENKILRDLLAKKDNDLSHSVTSCTHIVPISAQGEAQLKEPHKVERSLELAVLNTVTLGISDMSLMDDFVEMEKQAIVAINALQTSDSSSTKPCDWLQAVLNMILEQFHVSERSIDELLEDIRTAVHRETYEVRSSAHSRQNELLPISGYITWKSQTASPLNFLKSLQKDLELNLQSARDKSEALTSDVEQSQQSIKGLETELETLSESKRMMEEQFENQKLINEELDTHLTVAKARLNDVSQKLSSLEVELEDKSHCCEELEATCLELQLQLESFTSKEILRDDINQEGKLLQTGWEIKAASAKLAECEATILNLGNQLNALTPPKEASSANKTLSIPSKNNKKLNQRLSLLDRMLSEESTKMNDLKPSQSKELIMSTAETQMQPPSSKNSKAGALVVVPTKKRGRAIGFVRRLLLGRIRGSSKKTPFSFAT
ncbi:unnamed protein product [Coffea canephora]|uniref:Filament-like plant protein 7 n=1 Tax=Coffea canephora TaxID=49390 RepID=A0A068TLZ1_COFCA|nr:unnamed protein product [Coffea canephora]